MKNLIIIFIIFSWALNLKSQNVSKPITGKITYISSQNIYVKFESTKNFNIGDTLFIQKENSLIPVLKINNLSSTSCVCTALAENDLSVAMQIYARSDPSKSNGEENVNSIIPTNNIEVVDTSQSNIKNEVKKPEFAQKISGSVSISSYSNFSSISSANSTRFRYQLSFNAKNIGNSKISAETYVSFMHVKDKWAEVQDNVYKALKIYSLALKYDNNKNTQIIVGRKFNPKISSIGAIDGVQYEGRFNNFFLGAVAGSRPNYKDYSFDFSLPQFGAYLGYNYENANGLMQNSIAIFEQMNLSKTDRRFAYFQHSNTLLKNLYFFGSAEINLYKNIDSVPKNTFELSSAYLMLSYKMYKRLTLSTSYDNRKNVIYYESYKSYINQILDIEARQGLSLQANYYNLKNLSFGVKAGYRFANTNSKETKNLYAFVSYYNIPGVKLNIIGAVNYIETSYVNGKILNLNFSRNFLQNNLNIDFGYQLVDYLYIGEETATLQNVVNLSINWMFLKNLSFSANYENTFENQDQFSRLSLQIRKRF